MVCSSGENARRSLLEASLEKCIGFRVSTKRVGGPWWWGRGRYGVSTEKESISKVSKTTEVVNSERYKDDLLMGKVRSMGNVEFPFGTVVVYLKEWVCYRRYKGRCGSGKRWDGSECDVNSRAWFGGFVVMVFGVGEKI
jgi:hypothetical protein